MNPIDRITDRLFRPRYSSDERRKLPAAIVRTLAAAASGDRVAARSLAGICNRFDLDDEQRRRVTEFLARCAPVEVQP